MASSRKATGGENENHQHVAARESGSVLPGLRRKHVGHEVAPPPSQRQHASIARMRLSDPVRYLKGVGPEMARRLARLDIQTVGDLLFHVPVAYRDRRELARIADLIPGTEGSVVAAVMEKHVERRRGRRDLRATLRDETGFLRAVWFNQPFRAAQLVEGERYVFSGPVQTFRGIELHNPEFEPLEQDGEHVHVGRLAPKYPLTEGVTERWLRARVRDALDALGPVVDVVDDPWTGRFRLPSLREAFEIVHFPPELNDAVQARRRLALEELLRLQIQLQVARREHRAQKRAHPLTAGADVMQGFLDTLPFTLTGAQQRAIAAIGSDLDQGTPMRRLLLGDVGSGKTVVALAAAARAAGAGVQSALLAPTAILAEPHARTAEKLLRGALGLPGPNGVRFALLTAATGSAEREEILAGLSSGAISLAIGTHALLEKDLAFRKLGLVVVDEQHRFGVRQRVALAEKGTAGTGAHLLVLSATPIPRTLAMALYGDLDLSTLEEKPPGRFPVVTEVVKGSDRKGLLEIIVREIAEGGSAFVVYPVIEESEALDLKDATSKAAALSRVQELAQAGVALVHGRMKVAERREAIDRFRSGSVRVLVATTVVEVGIDVPDATLVVIEHPERFGLAQLHQLRGRVGRSERPGRCVLALSPNAGELARRRVAVFRKVTDGFRLAEEDLRLRG
ncbi:MAG TPA: ATP-dependent DNA helicase RecG, partial [Candidatus Eisenbacteria bacterium]|nr:ATP-dependent DNA helicase RecG [Candidatus Eisenbacteria bacterium]